MDNNLFPPDDSIIDTILTLYQRDAQSMKEDITTLRTWMSSQKHLPEVLDDKSLQNFLLLNKFSIEKSKSAIDAYYTVRSQFPDLYEDVNPSCKDMQETLENVYLLTLPQLTPDKYRVLIFKARHKELMHLLDPYKTQAMMLNMMEIRLKEDHMVGDVLIFDVKDLPMSHLAKITPSLLERFFLIYRKVYSIRLRGMHVLNSTPFVRTLVNVAKSFLKQKLSDRVHVYDDPSLLLDHVPKEILPPEFGGEGPHLEELHKLWKMKFSQYRDRFDLLDKLRVDESQRPDELKNDEMLGFHGNFKKLNVD